MEICWEEFTINITAITRTEANVAFGMKWKYGVSRLNANTVIILE